LGRQAFSRPACPLLIGIKKLLRVPSRGKKVQLQMLVFLEKVSMVALGLFD
jgi:hypothetical protein